jgi:hypothetical protein
VRTKLSFPNEHNMRLSGKISSALILKLNIFLFYTTKNTLRSNKFLFASFFVYFLLGMIYLGYSLSFSILPHDVSKLFLISVALSDFFLKYYIPGVFVEYVYPLLQITLFKNITSNYVILSLIFYYHNIVILLSFLLGVAIKPIVFLLAILILNHVIVFLFKMGVDYRSNRIMILFTLLMAILNLFCILFIQNMWVVISFLFITLLIFSQFLKCSLYVK